MIILQILVLSALLSLVLTSSEHIRKEKPKYDASSIGIPARNHKFNKSIPAPQIDLPKNFNLALEISTPHDGNLEIEITILGIHNQILLNLKLDKLMNSDIVVDFKKGEVYSTEFGVNCSYLEVDQYFNSKEFSSLLKMWQFFAIYEGLDANDNNFYFEFPSFLPEANRISLGFSNDKHELQVIEIVAAERGLKVITPITKIDNPKAAVRPTECKQFTDKDNFTSNILNQILKYATPENQ